MPSEGAILTYKHHCSWWMAEPTSIESGLRTGGSITLDEVTYVCRCLVCIPRTLITISSSMGCTHVTTTTKLADTHHRYGLL